jgi:chromosomal replication initiator protein
MYLARELTPLSLAEVARAFDRDHTTVLHATRAVAERLEPGSETAESLHRARLELGTGVPGPARCLTDPGSRPPDFDA